METAPCAAVGQIHDRGLPPHVTHVAVETDGRQYLAHIRKRNSAHPVLRWETPDGCPCSVEVSRDALCACVARGQSVLV